MTQTVLLIGATGRIGQSLLDELAPDHAAARLRVRVGVRSEKSRQLVLARGLDVCEVDVDRPATLDPAMKGADAVFHLRPYTFRQLMHGKLAADAAKRCGVRHVVTLGAFGRPETPHAVIAWNFLVEAYVERMMGTGWTHLQPNYFMDNVLVQRDPASATLFNRITVPVSWIAASDIAAVAAAVLRDPKRHAGKIYPLAEQAADAKQIAAWMSEITGRRHGTAVPPREKMMERLLAQGREPDYAAALVDYVDAVSRGEVPEIAQTFDTVRTVTGRAPVSFRDFLQRHLKPA
ncbi:MAG TPA: NmrA family NAD(P)-binding protein [Nevskiaceae bacterium]|nr:NmrA family NAD(P)-binding protein [Nevskiaceae bacterium]